MSVSYEDARGIIRDHYGLNRMPTLDETEKEIANLERKIKLGNCDDRQFRLASKLNLYRGITSEDLP